MRAWLFLLCAGVAGAQEGTVFRAGVSLVHVDAEVTQEGRILSGLTKNDFRVLDEKKEQTIVHFSAEEQPLDVIPLFDASGSMRPMVSKVADAARTALKELREGDRVGVMAFSFRSRVLLALTEDLAEVERTIRQDVMSQGFKGGTWIQNAMDHAAREFIQQKRTERRRAVLVITDNQGQRTRSSSSVVRDFWEADALLSGLIVGRQVPAALLVLAPQMAPIRVGIGPVAEQTGGDAIHADDPGAGFQEMMHRIRSRYSLYYSLPEAKAGSRRSIRVELAGDAAKLVPKARVRARTGYVVPAR